MTKSKFLKLVYESLNEYNISIPFPQTDLHIKDSIPFNININKNDLIN
jgi:small-conductance mechanosensitive channel